MPVLPDVSCRDEVMMSISHWGMFEVARPRLVVSMEMAAAIEKYRDEWKKPDGFIPLERVK